MNRHTYPVKARENETKLFTAKCVTNGTSNPDGLSANLTSVIRTAAGKFTVVIDTQYKCPQVLWAARPTIVGAAGYSVELTSIDTDANGAFSGFKFEVWARDAGTRASAAGTLTCDTKANSTDLDYFILNDGNNKAMLWYNVAGTTAAKYSKLGSKATCTMTCDSRTNTANEGFVNVWDGHRSWKIMLDTDGSGDSTGTADLIVDISGVADTAAGTAGAVHAIIMETTSIPGMTEAFHVTSVDNSDGTLTLTVDFAGYDGNGSCSIGGSLANAWACTNMVGATDAFPAEEFAECDISGATTAADVAAIVDTAIDALTEVRISSTDNEDGTLTLANDERGPAGNASQQYSETGTTLMALTDMTGGVDEYSQGADTNNYDVYFAFLLRNSKLTFR